jgi:hypothetical protein
MLDVHGGAGLWRSFRHKLFTVRSMPVIASAYAFLAGGNLCAHSADPDQPFRPIAITDSGDLDHAVHPA